MRTALATLGELLPEHSRALGLSQSWWQLFTHVRPWSGHVFLLFPPSNHLLFFWKWPRSVRGSPHPYFWFMLLRWNWPHHLAPGVGIAWDEVSRSSTWCWPQWLIYGWHSPRARLKVSTLVCCWEIPHIVSMITILEGHIFLGCPLTILLVARIKTKLNLGP